MIDMVSGIAPDRWQSFVGSVVVWRASYEPFSSDDAYLIHDYLNTLLDKYADGEVKLHRDVTSAAFQRSKQATLNFQRLNEEDVQQSKDLNI